MGGYHDIGIKLSKMASYYSLILVPVASQAVLWLMIMRSKVSETLLQHTEAPQENHESSLLGEQNTFLCFQPEYVLICLNMSNFKKSIIKQFIRTKR